MRGPPLHPLLFMFSALNSITSKHSTSSETRFTTTSSKKGSKETNTRNYLRARFYISRMLLFSPIFLSYTWEGTTPCELLNLLKQLFQLTCLSVHLNDPAPQGVSKIRQVKVEMSKFT